MASTKNDVQTSRMGRRVLLLVFFLLLLYVIVPRFGNFSASFDALGSAQPMYVLLACLLVVTTYFLAAATYWFVALKPQLAYWRTLSIQAASAFVNRLLPAGLGGLTLNVQYLRKQGYKTAQAAVVAGTNNLLGGAGHLLLLMIVLLLTRNTSATALRMPDVPHGWLAILIGLGMLAVALVAFKMLRGAISQTAVQIATYVAAYRKHPLRLVLGLTTSLLMTSCYALILYVSALSLGAELSLLQVFVIFTVGVAAATATPTPGGLVGAEAGLTAALVAYGVDGSLALAIALLYRFLTYWLPLLPGFVVFVLIRRLYLPIPRKN
ncbi:MAG: lysylphosphatidylglycerol synthase transmembrane domain-containing protein [Candidatus Saccharimonadales bacterium]